MNYTISQEAVGQAELPMEGETLSVYRAFEHVHVALDGKTLRGTLGHEAADQRKMHQVALYETGTGLVLKEQVVGDKENELSIVAQFLTPVWVKGRIISADARPSQLTALAATSPTVEATFCS